MRSRIALYKYLRYQWFNLWLLLEATSTTCLNWLSCTLLAALDAHRIEIPYWAFPERVGPQILSHESVDYFGTSDYFSGWKKDNLYQQNFAVYTGKPGSRIGDWGSEIGDSIEGKKNQDSTVLYKKFDPNNQFLYFIDHYISPSFWNPLCFTCCCDPFIFTPFDEFLFCHSCKSSVKSETTD